MFLHALASSLTGSWDITAASSAALTIFLFNSFHFTRASFACTMLLRLFAASSAFLSSSVITRRFWQSFLLGFTAINSCLQALLHVHLFQMKLDVIFTCSALRCRLRTRCVSSCVYGEHFTATVEPPGARAQNQQRRLLKLSVLPEGLSVFYRHSFCLLLRLLLSFFSLIKSRLKIL